MTKTQFSFQGRPWISSSCIEGVKVYSQSRFIFEFSCMIGIFDSGFGGLQTLKYFKDLYPEYDYLYLADSQFSPYGKKSADWVHNRTFDALNHLFDQWVALVILACNTAAAYAVKDWQKQYPEKKVLSITIPGVEKIVSQNCKKIWVLMTEATYNSAVYDELFTRFSKKDAFLEFVKAPKLVDAIESWLDCDDKRKKLVNWYMKKFSWWLDCLVLGCTHYPIWSQTFNSLFSKTIIDPAYESALQFGPYLQKHPEIKKTISCGWKVKFLVTWDKEKFQKFGEEIWGEGFVVERGEIIIKS